MAVNRRRKAAGGNTTVNAESDHMDDMNNFEYGNDDEEGGGHEEGERLSGYAPPLAARAPLDEPSLREFLRSPPPPLPPEPLGSAPPPLSAETVRSEPPPLSPEPVRFPPPPLSPEPRRSPPLRESLRSPPPPFRHHSLNPRSPERAARMRPRSAGISPWLFVMATALNTTVASVLAVIITLGVVRQEHPGTEGRQGVYPAYPQPAPMREAAFVSDAHRPRPLSLMPIGTPDQPLRLEPQRPAPLPLRVLPEEEANTPFIMALSGAPIGTALFGANRISPDSWYVPPGALSQIQIVVPEWSASVIEITILLRGGDGDLAAQTKAWVTVPPSTTAVPPADEASVKDLLTKADRLAARGDIIGARAVYERTVAMGSGAGALALGATYDPNRLWSLGVLGLTGNKDRARRWYQRASELGNADAKARIEALGL